MMAAMLTFLHSLFAPPRDLLLLVVAGWLGLLLSDRRARRHAVGERGFDTLVLWMLAAYIAGGRLAFLLGHTGAFLASPLSLFSLNRNAFDVPGALASAAIAWGIVVQRKHFPAWDSLDLLAPLLAALGVGMALSHLASGEAFGAEARLPWSIYQWGAWRHPAQAYELVAALGTLLLTWYWRGETRPGSRFMLWLALAAASRLTLEGFRGDSMLIAGGLRLAQIIAWVALAAALLALDRQIATAQNKDAEP